MIPLGVFMFILGPILGVFLADLHFLYFAGLLLLASIIVLVGVSLLGEAPDREKTEDLTWGPEYWRQETRELQGTPILLNYRFLSIVMLVSTFVIVFIFR